MSFDVDGARKAGYEDGEIASHLSKRYNFDLDGARKAGYSDQEVIDRLASMPRPRTTMEEVGRQVGLTARHGANAVASAIGVLSDPIAASINLATGSKIPFARETVDKAMTSLGVPEPQGKTERVVGAATEGMAGAASGIGAGRALANASAPAARVAGEALAAAPGMQVASGATGGASAATAREEGGGAGAQLAAGLAGAIAPSAARAAVHGAVRGVARGGEAARQQMESRLADLDAAGVNPTVGMATGNRRTQALESLLGKSPGGGGPMARTTERFNEDMGARVSDLADSVSRNADATSAGRAIEKGVKNFVGSFRMEQALQYAKLDKLIPKDTRINASNARAAFKELTEGIADAPATSTVLQNPKIKAIAEAFEKDLEANGGQLPYAAVKSLRSRIGAAIGDGSLVSDAPTRELKRLYGALSDDMQEAAAAAGPEAVKALNRANKYTAAGLSRIEDHLDRLRGTTADKTFNTVLSGGDPTKIGASIKSLPLAEKRVVQSAVIDRLGKATPGQQDAAGDVFSAVTFLTNWNRLPARSKAFLFADGTGQMRRDLDQIARAAEYSKEASKVLANSSGTASTAANYVAVGGVAMGVMTGNFGPAAAIIGGAVISNATARLMTNPSFVRWAARSTKLSPGALPAAFNALSQSASKSDDAQFAADVRAFIERAGSPAR